MMGDTSENLLRDVEKPGDSGTGVGIEASGNHQNGGHVAQTFTNTEINDNARVINAQGESETTQKDCAGCQKEVQAGQKGKPSHFSCNFCLKWFCLQCAEITRKPDIMFAERSDIFWSCKECTTMIHGLGENIKLQAYVAEPDEMKLPSNKAKRDDEILTKLEELKCTLEAKINSMEASVKTAFSDITAPSEKKIAETVTESVKSAFDDTIPVITGAVSSEVNKTWSNVLFGEKDFPGLNSDESRDAPEKPKSPDDFTVVTRRSRNSPKTLPQLITRSVAEAGMKEQRKNNVILYRVPEPENKEASDRLASDKKVVQDLMRHLKVHGEPLKVYRLGQYEEAKKNKGSRPIKVEFESPDKQIAIMTRAKMLKDAPSNLKEISLSHDLSEDQRVELKGLVERAKSQTSQSKNSVWRVRGYPGNWNLREFKITSP